MYFFWLRILPPSLSDANVCVPKGCKRKVGTCPKRCKRCRRCRDHNWLNSSAVMPAGGKERGFLSGLTVQQLYNLPRILSLITCRCFFGDFLRLRGDSDGERGGERDGGVEELDGELERRGEHLDGELDGVCPLSLLRFRDKLFFKRRSGGGSVGGVGVSSLPFPLP